MTKVGDNFYIPKKISIGFQERTDTYTGKLAYIIYWDNKGIHRKEKSWETWRDKKINPLEIENVPTEGFMLNRHVGGYSSGWDHRQSYCRVWDPRGFEFEITIDNLLWILDFCDCSKGKCISGKLIYSWVGQDLVLLPEATEEYKLCFDISRNKLLGKDFKSSDLIPGALYKNKSGSEYSGDTEIVFIGKVKFMKDFGKKFESKLLFYYLSKASGNKGKEFIVTKTIQDLEYKISDEYIDSAKIDEILHRFQLTAYSYDFWNTNSGFIKKIFNTESQVNYYNYNYKNSYFNLNGNEISYFRSGYSLEKNTNHYRYSYRTYNMKKFFYKSHIFELDNNKIIHKEIIRDLGVTKTNYCTNYQDIYPNSTQEEINDAIDNGIKDSEVNYYDKDLSGTKVSKFTVTYTTLDGYISHTLDGLLSNNAGITGCSIITNKMHIELPTKL